MSFLGFRVWREVDRAGQERNGSRVAFEKEKELTDRALNLAEVGKPKVNFPAAELRGIKTLKLKT